MNNVAAHVEIVVAGCPGVGKRTLINTLSQNELRPLEVERNSPRNGGGVNSDQPRNIVISTTTSRGELKQIGFHFSTDPGQGTLISIRDLPNATCAILVYDLTRRETFDELRSKFIPAVRAHLDSELCFTYIVANKVDLQSAARDVNEGQGKLLADQMGALFSEISAQKMIHVDIVMRQLRAKVQQLFRKYEANSMPRELQLSHSRSSQKLRKNPLGIGGLPMPARFTSKAYTSIDSGVGNVSIRSPTPPPPELPPRQSLSLGSALADSSLHSSRDQRRNKTEEIPVGETEERGIPTITDANPLHFPFTPGTAKQALLYSSFGGKSQSINESDLLFSSKDMMQGHPSIMSGFSLIATPMQKSASSIHGSPPSFVADPPQYLSPLESNPEYLHGDRSTLQQTPHSPILPPEIAPKLKEPFSNITFSQSMPKPSIDENFNPDLPSFLHIDANDSNFLKKLDKDIKKTEQSLKMMNQRFQTYQINAAANAHFQSQKIINLPLQQSQIQQVQTSQFQPIKQQSLYQPVNNLPLQQQNPAKIVKLRQSQGREQKQPIRTHSSYRGSFSQQKSPSPKQRVSPPPLSVEIPCIQSGGVATPAFPVGGSKATTISAGAGGAGGGGILNSVSPVKSVASYTKRYVENRIQPSRSRLSVGSKTGVKSSAIEERKSSCQRYHQKKQAPVVSLEAGGQLTGSALLVIKIKIAARKPAVTLHVYPDDTPETLVERCLFIANLTLPADRQANVKQRLAAIMEREVNYKIQEIQSLLPEELLQEILEPKSRASSRNSTRTIRSALLSPPKSARQHRPQRSSPISQKEVINPALFQPVRLSGSYRASTTTPPPKSDTLSRKRSTTTIETRDPGATLQSPPRRFVGRLTVHVGRDKSHDINLYEGEHIQSIAQAFVREHGLRPGVLASLTKSLEQLVEVDRSKQKQEEQKQQTLQFERLSSVLQDPGKSLSLLQSKSRNAVPEKVSQSLQSLMTTAKFDRPAATARTPAALSVSTKARTDLKRMLDFRSPSPEDMLRGGEQYRMTTADESPFRRKTGQKLESPKKGAGLLQMSDFLNSIPGSNRSSQSMKKSTVKASQLRKLQSHTVSETGQANRMYTQQQHSSILEAANRLQRICADNHSRSSTPLTARGRQTPQIMTARSSISALKGNLERSCGCRSPSPSLGRASKPPVRFIINFNLPTTGEKRKIRVRQGDNLYRLAYNFVITHKLQMRHTKEIWQMLKNSEKVGSPRSAQFHEQQVHQENMHPISPPISNELAGYLRES